MSEDMLALLRTLLVYNPTSGSFAHSAQSKYVVDRALVGMPAGSIDAYGYLVLSVGGRRIKAHRAVWLLERGVLPGVIDHIDGNPLNNRISNLREVTHAENRQNQRRVRSDSKTGLVGVHRRGDRFEARVRVSGKYRGLGVYPTPEQAHAAYLEGKRRLHAAFAG